jgi:L,D-peptidoglycan transpeptidase YkuD (ErfK/YbiS/YcfS/YnhG family)
MSTSAEELDVLLLLMDWHADKVKRLREIQGSVDEGTKLGMQGEEAVTTLSARDAALFQAGMEAVLCEIGTLPLKVESTEGEPKTPIGPTDT